MPLPDPHGEEGWLLVYKRLLPPGPFWDAYRLPGGEGEKMLRARAKVLAACEAEMYLLLGELIPSGALKTLFSREGEAGLPGCCSATISDNREARIAEIVAIWNGRGGIDADYFIELAARLGAQGSTTTAFNAFTCETNCDQPVYDENWHNVWRLNVPDYPVYEFSCDSGCDEPLRMWGDARLECEIKRKTPSGTIVHIGYGEI